MSEAFTSSGAPVEVRCAYHPDTETLLRCSRCGKPICPKCGIRTPVGMRCPDCAGVAAQVGPLGGERLLRAVGMGLAAAVPVGILWGLFPEWGFYLGLLLGFAGAEMVAKGAPGRSGPDMQAIAVAVVLVGLVVSRAVLASRWGIPLGEIDPFSRPVQRALFLRPIPDLVFAALPLVIAFFRFR